MSFSSALYAKKQACPVLFEQPGADAAAFEAPAFLDELVRQQEAERRRALRPHHHAKKALMRLKRILSSQGKRSQADQEQEKGGLDVGASTTTAGEPWKAPAGLSKAFESNCTVTTAASDDSGSESSRSSRSGLGDLVVDLEEAELAVALAFRSLDEALHPHHAADHHQHHHHPQQRRRRHQRKAAAHLRRLHSHADLDVHAPIRFLI